MSKDGLDQDGGISFSRKLNEKDKKPYGLAEPKDNTEIEVEEPKRLDTEELLRQERLDAQLSKAKTINYSGYGVNGATIIGSLFYLDSLLMSPDVMDSLNMINKMFGLEIDFEGVITTFQQYKAELIGFCISFQTMLVGYKDTCQKAKDRDCDSLYQVFTEELEKAGI